MKKIIFGVILATFLVVGFSGHVNKGVQTADIVPPTPDVTTFA